jgi:hypothetical protein
MKKMKLALDDLAVESFAPAEDPQRRGTVHAHDSGPYTDECLSCGVETGCGYGGCDSQHCSQGCGSNTCTCYGYYTCAGVNTCDFVETCIYPQCTAPGAAC